MAAFFFDAAKVQKNNYLGVSASPPVSGSKSAAGSRVLAMLQKELPPVALLQQRHIGFRTLRAFRLRPHAADGKGFALYFICAFVAIHSSHKSSKKKHKTF